MNEEYFDKQTKEAINYSAHLLHVTMDNQLDSSMSESVLETLFVWQALVLNAMRNGSKQEVDRVIKKYQRVLKNRGYLYTRNLVANLFTDGHGSTPEVDHYLQHELKYLKQQGIDHRDLLDKTVLRLYMWL